MNLTKTAITRPMFIFMLMAAAFIMGFLGYKGMRQELNPDVSFGTVTITTQYPGASPDDINELVSRKIEEAVASVNGIREITSTSQEGISTVVVTFNLGINEDSALSDVRSKVDATANDLPKDALKPTIQKFDSSSQPILTLDFSSDLSGKALRDLIDDKLNDQFSQINGVASAAVQGGDTREIQVRLHKDRLLAYGVGISDIQQAVANASLNAPSGRVVTPSQEFTVRVKGEFTDPSQIANMMITISDPKNPMSKSRTVRLSDVATVVDSTAERTSYSRLNGKDAIVMSLQKAKDGNSVDIANGTDQVIAKLQATYSNIHLKIVKTYEEATQIRDSIADLNFALGFGIFLVAAIVFIFLHNLRGTIIVALAIPTSIFATFIAMNLLGFTINNMSMLSLSLAIGVLVDDAIVVLENIYRHLKLGEDPRQAALNGRMEIGMAALAITFADVVVFTPIAFMGGIVGEFFKPMALGFVCATLFSLFVSFTLTPLLASRWYRAGEDMEHPVGWFATSFERGFERLQNFYRRVLEWSLNHRWFVFILGNCALVSVGLFIGGTFVPSVAPTGPTAVKGTPFGIPAAFGMGIPLVVIALIIGVIVTIVNAFRHRFHLKYIVSAFLFGLIFPIAAVAGYGYHQWKGEDVFKFGFLPDTDSGLVQANIELAPSANLDDTQRVVESIEKTMMLDKDVKYVVSTVGTQGVGALNAASSGSNYGQITATLYDREVFTDRMPWARKEKQYRHGSSTTLAAKFTKEIGHIPGVFVKVSAPSAFAFGADIQLSFTSDNRDLLLKTAEAVKDGLAQGAIKGVVNPDISSKEGKPELQVHPDRLLLADAGKTVSDAAKAIQTLYQGNDDTKMRVNGREYPIRVMMDLRDRNNPDVLSEVPLAFNQGSPIFLSQVASIGQAPGIDKITRRARSEEIQVTADLLPGYANGTVQAQINSWITQQKLVPKGVTYKPLGQADAQSREQGGMFLSLALGFVLVYMVLASLYDNLLYPLVIQMAQPQAMVGAILALIFTNKSFNLVGFIGIVALVGLVGKNAILVVDYTNTLRGRGRNRHDALAEAGPTRLRPILMTTMALILGMLPVALAIGRGSEFRETIGITIIGGMLLSTVLTLVVIPCSYTIFDDISMALDRFKRGILHLDPPSEPHFGIREIGGDTPADTPAHTS